MRMKPKHSHGGFVYHISTECSGWKSDKRLGRDQEGTGDKPLCTTCLSLLRRSAG